MAVKIKLKRMGAIRDPYYRIVVADSRTKRDGRAIEEIGKYHPKEDPSVIEVNSDRVQHWLASARSRPTRCGTCSRVTGDWQKFKGEPAPQPRVRPPRSTRPRHAVEGPRYGRDHDVKPRDPKQAKKAQPEAARRGACRGGTGRAAEAAAPGRG